MEEDMLSVLQHAKDAVLWDALPGRSPTSQLPTLPELGKVFQAENYQGSFVDMLKEKLSTDIIFDIFCKTKKQRHSIVKSKSRWNYFLQMLQHRHFRN